MCPNNKNLPAAGVPVDDLDVPREPEELRREISEAIEKRVETALKQIRDSMTKKDYTTLNRLMLLEKAKYITDELISNVLVESPTPRGFEVLGQMFKTTAELIDKVAEDTEEPTENSGSGTYSQGSGSGKTVVVVSQEVFDAVRAMRHTKKPRTAKVETVREEEPKHGQ